MSSVCLFMPVNAVLPGGVLSRLCKGIVKTVRPDSAEREECWWEDEAPGFAGRRGSRGDEMGSGIESECAEETGIGPGAGAADGNVFGGEHANAFIHGGADGHQEQIDELRHTAGEEQGVGVKGGDKIGGGDAEAVGGGAEGALGLRVAIACGTGGGFGIGKAGGASDGGAGGEGFQTAGIAAAAEGPVGLDGHVANLAGGRKRAKAEAAIDDKAAADAGAEGEENERGVFSAVAVEELAEGGATGIVEEANGDAEVLVENGGGRYAAPLGGEVGDEVNGACASVDEAGDANAKRGGPLAGFRGEGIDERSDGGEDGRGLGPVRRGDRFATNQTAIRCAEGGGDFRSAEIDGGKEGFHRGL
jgi:hypothetical protein